MTELLLLMKWLFTYSDLWKIRTCYYNYWPFCRTIFC